MSLDSAYHASAADAQVKKPPTVPDAGDHQVASPTGLAGNKIEQEGVLGAWTKDLLKEGSQAWHGFTNMFNGADAGSDKAKPNIEHVNDISHLTFSDVFGKGDGKPAPAEAKTVSTTDGKAHVAETNDHGVTTDVTATKNYISGQVGDAHIDQNKKTRETKYNDGTFHADVTTHGEAVKGPNGDTTTWNKDTHEGSVTGPDGKPILRMHANGDLTHQLTPHSELTQTNGDAAATARAVRDHDQANGTPRDRTRIFEDNKGNVAIMRRDGLDITTDKASGDVTLEKGGHKIVVHDGKASAAVVGDDGQTHMVPLQNDQLPNGMKVNTDGSVAVDGKTVVDPKGHVQADDHTTVDARKGAVTTQADSGTVHTTSDGHSTTVQQAGVGTITNDGTSYHNSDQATQGVFKDWNPQAQTYDVGGPGQSGVHFDTSQNGGVTMTDQNGQCTSIFNNGVVNAIDSFGDALFGIDQSGNSMFGDGSSISYDGSVFNSDDGSSSGSAWGGTGDSSGSGIDSSASGDISDASAAVDFANDGGTVDPSSGDPLVTGSVTGDPTSDLTTDPGVNTDASVLATLGAEDGAIGDEIAANVGKKGSANLIAALQNTEDRVEGTESNVAGKLSAEETAPKTGSAAVTRLMAAGMSREQAMNELARGNDAAEAA